MHEKPGLVVDVGSSPKSKVDSGGHNLCSDSLEDRPNVVPNPHAPRIDMEVSYPKWCAMLVSLVLKTRTPFAAFVARSIRLSRESRCEASTPTFFPIPFPVTHWGRMPEKCSAKKRHSIHLSRALFVIVAALNHWHSGGKVSDVSIFQRVPNAVHRRLFQKVRDLIKSDGPATSFRLMKGGRRFPELISRLDELSSFLTAAVCLQIPMKSPLEGPKWPKIIPFCLSFSLFRISIPNA